MTERYIELHARSAFSFLRGAATPEELIAVCSELKMPAMALLDNDGVYGAARFHLAAQKVEGIKAHIGAEITVSTSSTEIPNSKFQIPNAKPTTQNSKPPTQNSSSPTQNSKLKTHNSTVALPLLIRNRTGYQNLCRLITLMKLRVPKHAKPGECAVTLNELAEYADGLVSLTGAEDGPLASELIHRGPREAENTTARLIDIFGRENVYAELQRHFNREE
jgi:error-prone DNA polymerase